MDEFLHWKKQSLGKLDKSPKSSIDERVKLLCDVINQRDDMFSLSSCSGRVCLLEISDEGKKDSNWLIVSHDLADFLDFYKNFDSYNGEKRIYFKQESCIMHICVKNIDIAKELIHIARESGFNHAGIISLRKITVELICDVSISTLIYDKKKLIDEGYMKVLIKEGNKNQKLSWSAIEKLKNKITKLTYNEY
ncbi:MAG: hypothetical protein KC589_07275 [Nanoarchaeota archaeon]|nr:hypothetical protein [Nanoarchaeota archaeon]